jgi:hypothetical protein
VFRVELELVEEDDRLFVDEEPALELLEVPDEGRELVPEELAEPLVVTRLDVFLGA